VPIPSPTAQIIVHCFTVKTDWIKPPAGK